MTSFFQWDKIEEWSESLLSLDRSLCENLAVGVTWNERKIRQRLMRPGLVVEPDVAANFFPCWQFIGIVSHQIDLLLFNRSIKPLGDCVVVKINVAAVVAVLSLSPTGPESRAGIGAECVASMNHTYVNMQDEVDREILKSANPAQRELNVIPLPLWSKLNCHCLAKRYAVMTKR